MEVRECFSVDPRKVVHETLDGEVILIHLDTGTYYSLRGGGAEVFGYALQGASAGQIDDAVAAIHGEGAAADATRVLAELVAEELLVRTPESPARLPPEGQHGGSWEPPILERFTDMQDYLRMDPIHDVTPAGWPNVAVG